MAKFPIKTSDYTRNRQSRSSHAWLKEHFDDPYVKKAQQLGYRTRASFKLLEIDDKAHLLKPGMTIIDLGAAPGGWSQIASQRVGRKGRVIASDILPIDPLPQVEFVQGDFTTIEVLEQILMTLAPAKADILLSDMAPNMSGQKAVDQPKAIYLAELAFELSEQTLKPQGHLLVKLFQGEGFDCYINMIRKKFTKVSLCKPPASRPRSPEIYILAQGFKK